MTISGIGIDYSNVCKDYNTAYLDRDNKDPQTTQCMNQVLEWMHAFLTAITERFGYQIYHLNDCTPVSIDEVASKRFLFYSLEKEITLQSYVLQKEPKAYESLTAWSVQNDAGFLIQNDEDGEGIYLYFANDPDMQSWLVKTLDGFSLDDVTFVAS